MDSTGRIDALALGSVELEDDRPPSIPSPAHSNGLRPSIMIGSESTVGVDSPSQLGNERIIKLPLRDQDSLVTEAHNLVVVGFSDPMGPAEVGGEMDVAVGGDMSEQGGGVAAQIIRSEEKTKTEETAVYGELLRARDAWRDAEGELARSQAERDELRTVLRSVRGLTCWLRCGSE